MKKKIKIVISLIIIVALIFIPNINSFAASSLDDIVNGASSFLNEGANSGSVPITDDEMRNTSNLLVDVLTVLGIVIIVIWGMVLGIRFIIGSVEEQAEVKKALLPYGVGCVIIFGAFTIWRVVVTIASQLG